MALDTSVVGYETKAYEYKYDWKLASLYSLGIGARRDELDYIYEARGPKVYPTFAVIPSFEVLGDLVGKTQGNPMTIVHGAQAIKVFKPFPSEGTIVTVGRIRGLYDLRKMASVVCVTESSVGGEKVASAEWTIIFRGEGGFGGEAPPKEEVPEVPATDPTWTVTESTSPEQALLYRLSGDLNPLHADPQLAAMVGFPQGPILHGLCTYGFVGRAVAQRAAGGDASRIRALHAQFRKPVWPGETITTKGWDLGGGIVALRAYAADRPDAVITSSWAEIG